MIKAARKVAKSVKPVVIIASAFASSSLDEKSVTSLIRLTRIGTAQFVYLQNEKTRKELRVFHTYKLLCSVQLQYVPLGAKSQQGRLNSLSGEVMLRILRNLLET